MTEWQKEIAKKSEQTTVIWVVHFAWVNTNVLDKSSKVYEMYGEVIRERHRHRYEVNRNREKLESGD